MKPRRRTTIGFVVYVVMVPILQILMKNFHIPELLGEDAVTNWANDQIAEKLGITSPSIEQVTSLLVTWVPPAGFALLCLSGWILALHVSTRRQEPTPANAADIVRPSDQSNKSVAKEERKPLSMRQIFDSDFPGMGKTFMDLHMKQAGREAKLSVTEFWNIPANSFFLAFYPHDKENTFDTIAGAAGAVTLLIKELGKIYFEVTTPGDTRIVTNDTMIFSGQMYCYLEQDMSLLQLSKLEAIYLSHGYRITFRGSAYHILHWEEHERWPVGTGPEGNSGAQLPNAVTGLQIKVHNRIDNKPSQGVVQIITNQELGSVTDRGS